MSVCVPFLVFVCLTASFVVFGILCAFFVHFIPKVLFSRRFFCRLVRAGTPIRGTFYSKNVTKRFRPERSSIELDSNQMGKQIELPHFEYIFGQQDEALYIHWSVIVHVKFTQWAPYSMYLERSSGHQVKLNMAGNGGLRYVSFSPPTLSYLKELLK